MKYLILATLVSPGIVDMLLGEPAAAYNAWLLSIDEPHRRRRGLVLSDFRKLRIPTGGPGDELWRNLVSTVKRCIVKSHLCESAVPNWLMRAALLSLELWVRNGRNKGLVWVGADNDPRHPSVAAPPSWEPLLETKEAYLRRARKTITEHIQQVESAYLHAGFRQLPERRVRHGVNTTRRLEWLVWYQVLRTSYREIGGVEELEPKAVARAIRELGEEIGLSVRKPTKGGRPRGSIDSPRKRRHVVRR